MCHPLSGGTFRLESLFGTPSNGCPFLNTLILLKGAGDRGTGVAYRLHRAGFSIMALLATFPLLAAM